MTRLVLVGIVGLLGVALWQGPPVLRTHPIAAPLTLVPGLGVDVLAQGASPRPDALRRAVAQVIQATGSPAQRAAVRPLEAPPSMKVREGERLRAQVQADAVALYAALGPERVEAMVQARPALAAEYGELSVWAAVTGRR